MLNLVSKTMMIAKFRAMLYFRLSLLSLMSYLFYALSEFKLFDYGEDPNADVLIRRPLKAPPANPWT